MSCEIVAVAASETNDHEHKIDDARLESECARDARRRRMDHYADIDLIRGCPLPG
ncbi:hypothetical protein GCM10020370_06130 [Paenibacillus hodogayensis]